MSSLKFALTMDELMERMRCLVNLEKGGCMLVIKGASVEEIVGIDGG